MVPTVLDPTQLPWFDAYARAPRDRFNCYAFYPEQAPIQGRRFLHWFHCQTNPIVTHSTPERGDIQMVQGRRNRRSEFAETARSVNSPITASVNQSRLQNVPISTEWEYCEKAGATMRADSLNTKKTKEINGVSNLPSDRHRRGGGVNSLPGVDGVTSGIPPWCDSILIDARVADAAVQGQCFSCKMMILIGDVLPLRC